MKIALVLTIRVSDTRSKKVQDRTHTHKVRTLRTPPLQLSHSARYVLSNVIVSSVSQTKNQSNVSHLPPAVPVFESVVCVLKVCDWYFSCDLESDCVIVIGKMRD